MADFPRIELILGGQKSGKSRLAEARAQAWLSGASPRRSVMIATGLPWDDEMRDRIVRHQIDRAQRVPGMVTHEEPRELAKALKQLSQPDTLLVVDCLTLWLTQALMPPPSMAPITDVAAWISELQDTLLQLPGPVVLVGNEIGLGVIPMGPETRRFVDALGVLNQQVAQVADRVVLLMAGCTLTIKEGRS
jgi:adenosylcobinamide kinase / adenosylcobinamide-phosphate guanylyltransferase